MSRITIMRSVARERGLHERRLMHSYHTNQSHITPTRGLSHVREAFNMRVNSHVREDSCTRCMIYLILPPLRVGSRSPCSKQSPVTFAKEISVHSLEFEGDSQCFISALKNSKLQTFVKQLVTLAFFLLLLLRRKNISLQSFTFNHDDKREGNFLAHAFCNDLFLIMLIRWTIVQLIPFAMVCFFLVFFFFFFLREYNYLAHDLARRTILSILYIRKIPLFQLDFFVIQKYSH